MQHDSAGEAEAAGHSSVMRWVQQGRGEAAGTAECSRAVEKGSVGQDEDAAECSQKVHWEEQQDAAGYSSTRKGEQQCATG